MDKPLTIGIAMIAKNEKEHIGRALDSAKDADQKVVCDTGSSDDGETVRIAKEKGAIVYEDYRWEDSFCKARNHVKSKMTTDWIFSLDCDEFIHDFLEVRSAAAEAEAKGISAVNVTQVNESDGQINRFPRLFKNSPGITWHGAAHNYLNVVGEDIGNVTLTYGFSKAHLLDPDRTLRILETEYKAGRAGAREMYYLGREYKNKGRFEEATAVLGKYVQISRFPAEKAEAFLNMAYCYWERRQLNDARDACVQALIINPDFKEAHFFMAKISEPRQARRWQQFAQIADNSNVLFVRTK